MFYLQNIALKYGDRHLLRDVSFMFQHKDRIGLVGRNGAGKTTLLKIIAQDIFPDSGQVQLPKNTQIGFLKQFLPEDQQTPILKEVCKAFSEYYDLKAKAESLEDRLGEELTEEEMTQVLEELDKLNLRLSNFDVNNPEAEAARVLKGLGFKDIQLDQPLNTLSGGWVMRVELAKLLLSKPDILLLDEPTNHLDIEAIIWFEDYIKSYPACTILISHDETFLANTTNRIIEIELGNIQDYKMTYDKYQIEKANRKAIRTSEYQNQQRLIKERERTITRFKAKATKTKMAQSMEKQLAKMERIELVEEDTSAMRLSFPYAGREGKIVYKATDLIKKYDELTVLDKVDIQIERGEKVAFIGQNGQGKTTLSKIIAGMTPATGGQSDIGHNVNLSIYLQDQSDSLERSRTILETAEYHGAHYTNTELRSILGAFMFSGEDVEKKVSVLSGGEKARVALACMIMQPSNLLILDEPTNHLDVVSKSILKDAVRKYEGTLVIVSHDRAFLKGLTEKTYEFVDKQIVEHLGDIEYVLKKRNHDNLRDYAVTKNQEQKTVTETKLSFEERKKLNRALNYAERDIDKLEKKIDAIEQEMIDPEFFKSPEGTEKMKALTKFKSELETKLSEWETLAEQLGE